MSKWRKRKIKTIFFVLFIAAINVIFFAKLYPFYVQVYNAIREFFNEFAF